MRITLLPLFLCTALLGIYIENPKHLEKHQMLAKEEPFQAIGFLACSGRLGTGTLIHPRAVLTAAHTLKGGKKATFHIYLDNATLKISVGKVILHPEYEKNRKTSNGNIHRENMPYDLAIVILDKPIEGIICPELSILPPSGPLKFYTCGYGGLGRPNSCQRVDKKLAASVYFGILKENGSKVSIPCENLLGLDLFGSPRPGDSGSPLLTLGDEIVIHGILSCVSFPGKGMKGQKASYPLVYTKIDWIIDTIETNL